MRKSMVLVEMLIVTLLLGADPSTAQQKSVGDEGGRILALEQAWNRALEEKNSNALDMLLLLFPEADLLFRNGRTPEPS